MKVYLHMHNGNVQQNPLCVESCVTKEFSISPRFSPTIFYRDANSVQRECPTEPFMRSTLCHQGYSHLSPVPAYIFLSPGKSSTAQTVHRFLYTPAQVHAPCRFEAHYARNKKLKNVYFFLKKNLKIVLDT